MIQLNPYLNFKGNCREAFTTYERVLGGKIEMMMTFGESPMAGDVEPGMKEQIMHVSMTVGDRRLMGSDAGCQQVQTPQGFAVSINTNDVGEAARVFDGLAEGGTIQMPLAPTFWALRFGMLTDRFGTPWMVNCEAPR